MLGGHTSLTLGTLCSDISVVTLLSYYFTEQMLLNQYHFDYQLAVILIPLRCTLRGHRYGQMQMIAQISLCYAQGQLRYNVNNFYLSFTGLLFVCCISHK